MAIDGKYEIKINTPIGDMEFTMDLTTDGNIISGTMSVEGKVDEVTGTADGDNFVIKVPVATPMGEFPGTATGKVEGDSTSGVLQIPIGKMKFKGNRIS